MRPAEVGADGNTGGCPHAKCCLHRAPAEEGRECSRGQGGKGVVFTVHLQRGGGRAEGGRNLGGGGGWQGLGGGGEGRD